MAFEDRLMEWIKADEGRIREDEKIQDFIRILYQDILEEEGTPHRVLRRWVKNKTIEEQWDYCKEHFPAYMRLTSQEKHFAGSPEAASIGYSLGLDIAIYGRDLASSLYVSVDQGHQDRVLPCYETKTGSHKTIKIFQVRGGGHYKSLVPKEG